MERLQSTIFYALDKAIKTYRQMAQASLTRAGLDITIDQWLVLRTIQEHPSIPQAEIAVMVFKDFASITRITQLLELKGLVARTPHATDGRRTSLALTAAGRRAITSVEPLVVQNRRRALRGVAPRAVRDANDVLKAIIENCRSQVPE